jgi:hypothetical protein
MEWGRFSGYRQEIQAQIQLGPDPGVGQEVGCEMGQMQEGSGHKRKTSMFLLAGHLEVCWV